MFLEKVKNSTRKVVPRLWIVSGSIGIAGQYYARYDTDDKRGDTFGGRGQSCIAVRRIVVLLR